MKITPRRYTIGCVVVLVGLCGLIQGVVIARTTVPSIDCVRFVSIAQRIEAVGFASTFRAEGEQPLYPLAVNWTHGLLSAVFGESPALWAVSAQLAAALAAVLAVIPIYFISRRLVGSCGGFIAGVFFCVLPEVARLGADGIADSTHLLFFALAFWALLEYMQSHGNANSPFKKCATAGLSSSECGKTRENTAGQASSGTRNSQNRLFQRAAERICRNAIRNQLTCLAGLAAGLAVLTRVETIVLFPALFAAAFFEFMRNSHARKSTEGSTGSSSLLWKKPFAAAFGVSLAASLVIAPYLLAVGTTSASDAVDRVLGRWAPPSSDTAGEEAEHWRPADGRELAFDIKEPGTSIRQRGWAAALMQFGKEAADAFGYVVGALSIAGVLYMRRLGAIRFGAVECLIAVFCVLFAAVVVSFTAAEGYLTARHLLLLVAVGIGPSGCGAIALAHRLRRRQTRFFAIRPLPAVVFCVAAICLITTLRPLRAARDADRQAGRWLAADARGGAVLDTKGWTGLYSTLPTFQYDRAREAFADSRLAYVVVQREDLQSASGRGRTLRFLLEEAGERAATFAVHDGRSEVTVYRWHPERFRRTIVGTHQTSEQVTIQTTRHKGRS